MRHEYTGDITSQGGRAIAWHLRQGLNNGDISRDTLALWIESVSDLHDRLKADRDGLLKALKTIRDLYAGNAYAYVDQVDAIARVAIAAAEKEPKP